HTVLQIEQVEALIFIRQHDHFTGSLAIYSDEFDAGNRDAGFLDEVKWKRRVGQKEPDLALPVDLPVTRQGVASRRNESHGQQNCRHCPWYSRTYWHRTALHIDSAFGYW